MIAGLSDEAFWEREQTLDFERYLADQSFAWHALEGWSECRRRAIVMIENEMEHSAELRTDLESRILDLEALLETERRRTFDYVWDYHEGNRHPLAREELWREYLKINER